MIEKLHVAYGRKECNMYVALCKGTEAPFTGKYYDNHEDGMYRCKACGNPLFSSDAKFDSGTGWPSFVEPIPGSVTMCLDDSNGPHSSNFGWASMRRTEVLCAKCGSHLGHVFPDGPKEMPDGKKTTGDRFCINSICLDLEKK